MKNLFIKLIATATLLVSISSVSTATPLEVIKGEINFGGTSIATIKDAQIERVVFKDDVKVATATQTFSILKNVTADFKSPFVVGPIDSLWTVGGFTFSITNIVENVAKGYFGAIVANGTISAQGYQTTAAKFVYTTQLIGGNEERTFSATAVPAPATIALLGLALVGFGAARRKKQA